MASRWIVPCIGTYRQHKWSMVCANVYRCILCDNLDVDWTQMQHLGGDALWHDFDSESAYMMSASWDATMRVKPSFSCLPETTRIFSGCIGGQFVEPYR